MSGSLPSYKTIRASDNKRQKLGVINVPAIFASKYTFCIFLCNMVNIVNGEMVNAIVNIMILL